MADRNSGKSVMGNLPNTRPARIGGRRERRADEPAAKQRTATKAAPPKRKSTTAKPRAVRSGSPALKAAKDKRTAPPPRPQASPPKGTELVTTAVQAAGELAQISLTLGGRAVKRAVRRLPKP